MDARGEQYPTRVFEESITHLPKAITGEEGLDDPLAKQKKTEFQRT